MVSDVRGSCQTAWNPLLRCLYCRWGVAQFAALSPSTADFLGDVATFKYQDGRLEEGRSGPEAAVGLVECAATGGIVGGKKPERARSAGQSLAGAMFGTGADRLWAAASTAGALKQAAFGGLQRARFSIRRREGSVGVGRREVAGVRTVGCKEGEEALRVRREASRKLKWLILGN